MPLHAGKVAKPTHAAKGKKKVHTTQKRNKSRAIHRVQGKIEPKVNIFVKKPGGKNDFLNLHPTPGPLYEDPQGLEPFPEENRGANNYDPNQTNNQWRLMAGVAPPALPKTIPYTAQDTLYTYSKRVHKLQTKALVNAMREMEEMRIQRNHVVATRKAKEISDRSKIYGDWKHRRFIKRQFDHTVRLQKHAAALAVSYKRGQESQEELAIQTAKRQAKYIELLMAERSTTWIEDGDNVDPKIFGTISALPTGWWPIDDDQSMYMSKFETDDQDKNDYFVTHYPPFTTIKPARNELTQLYQDMRNTQGWEKEKAKLHQQNDIIFAGQLNQTETHEFDSTTEEDFTTVLSPVVRTPVERRTALRNKPFIDGEFETKTRQFERMYGDADAPLPDEYSSEM